MGIKPKGPLILLHETEALLCAHSQSVQQASFVWRSAFLTTNSLKEEYFLYLVSYKIKTGFDAHTLFCPVDSKFFSLKKGAYFLRILLVVNIQTYAYGPSRALGKKALAICVQSHNCSSSSVMLLFISRHVWRGNFEIICCIPLNVKFLRSGKSK